MAEAEKHVDEERSGGNYGGLENATKLRQIRSSASLAVANRPKWNQPRSPQQQRRLRRPTAPVQPRQSIKVSQEQHAVLATLRATVAATHWRRRTLAHHARSGNSGDR